ncbi:unnamed protein product [Clonostachys rhizophaga]|uniref:Sexual differentiation process protein isp4 n=1 Tax=Clonostachys rhizophaga TaxID=160324 RepID=A0A9N9YTN7_9HYPO|nr:unnamed protein product [Clonostachys rhizophaga]
MAAYASGLGRENLDIEIATRAHIDVKKEQEVGEVLSSYDAEIKTGEQAAVSVEVQAAVPVVDEDVPASTLRAWVIGLILTTVGSGLNMLFSLRNPSIFITSIVAQLVAYPLGVLWARLMPDKTITLLGHKMSLNPGPFNKKEHTVIVVMANASFGNGYLYGTELLLTQEKFYGYSFGWGFRILLIVSTQMMGYGMAGLCRRFLVWPAAMIWPATLVNTTLFTTLHDRTPTTTGMESGWVIGRYRYFLYVMIGAFAWYWVPGVLFQGLSVFAFATWIKPKSPIVNQLFGGFSGLSLIPITFDWTYVSGFLASPLIPPWTAIANMVAGMFIFVILGGIIAHYSEAWYSAYLPMSTARVYDNTGAPYNVSRVLGTGFTLDAEKYKAYSPVFVSTTNAIAYGLQLGTVVAVLVHTALFNGKDLWARLRAARDQEDDIHMRLIKKYPDAPDWWYLAMFLVMLALAFITCLVWDSQLPWWALVLSLIIPAVWIVPIGMIQAISNIQLGLSVITEFIIGYMRPGRPLGMMLFKTYGYITMFQGLAFIQDLKLGHYMKVPPKALFWAQTVATFWGSLVQVAVYGWALNAIPNICAVDQVNKFTCPYGNTFFTSSVVWGLVGPARIFNPGMIYNSVLWFFLLGLILPIAVFVCSKVWPKSSFFKNINTPLLIGGSGYIPPGTPLSYLSWGAVGFVFNSLIKNRWRGWWMQYNYITSAGLDIGLAVCTILIFFTIQLTNTKVPQWWGNVDVFNTLDASVDLNVQKTVGPGETFGPQSW